MSYLCECGCGAPVPIATRTRSSRGIVKGQPMRFISGHNSAPRPESPEQTLARFWSKVEKRGPDECWPWLGGTFRGGYGQFKIAGTPKVATRVLMELTTGQPVPAHLFVCHHCDNPQCVNPAHLFLGTAADNNRDMVRKGRSRHPARGEGSARKLTPDQVAEIRARYAEGGISQMQLGRQYGVQQTAVANIVTGKTW